MTLLLLLRFVRLLFGFRRAPVPYPARRSCVIQEGVGLGCMGHLGVSGVLGLSYAWAARTPRERPTVGLTLLSLKFAGGTAHFSGRVAVAIDREKRKRERSSKAKLVPFWKLEAAECSALFSPSHQKSTHS